MRIVINSVATDTVFNYPPYVLLTNLAARDRSYHQFGKNQPSAELASVPFYHASPHNVNLPSQKLINCHFYLAIDYVVHFLWVLN